MSARVVDDRTEAVEALIAEAAAESEPAIIVACQGPPRCDLQGEAAEEAQRNGCPWCEIITVVPGGATYRNGPGHA